MFFRWSRRIWAVALVTWIRDSKSAAHELEINPEKLDLKTWLEKLTQRYQTTNIDITLNTPSQAITANFDPILLKHAVDNLLTNALKYAKKSIQVTLTQDDNQTTISIEDDGQGIPLEDRIQIFNAFASLESSTDYDKHIGLGLSIAKSIVELHHGYIKVDDSTTLGGSKFSINIGAM